MEDALAQILQQPTSLLAAGRTDSGVHAVGQVIAFAADWDGPLADLQRALNAVLPDDVAVSALSVASLGFHPRYDAISRTYCYTIWNRPLRSPLLRRTTLWVRRQLDAAAMNEAAQLLVGSHDFSTFGTAPRSTPRHRTTSQSGPDERPPKPSTVRHVVRVGWTRVDEARRSAGAPQMACSQTMLQALSSNADRALAVGGKGLEWQGLGEFVIEANAFLYRMVRSIVGTLIQVGRGDLSVSEFAAALNATDRARAGPTAQPHGLCLVKVRYPNECR